MARQPQVTRTMKSTKATVLVVNLETKATEEIIVEVPRVHKDDTQLLKVVAEQDTLKGKKPVMIVSKELVENLYGMPEHEFMKHAKVITKEENV